MRQIKEIIIHCSATLEGKDYTIADIDHWHKAKGWKGVGYHFIIYRDGSVVTGRSIESVGAHCLGHNTHSIGICYIGGLSKDGTPKDTRTPKQKMSLRELVRKLKVTYPDATIHGHYEFAFKSCPCFRVPEEL